MNEKEKKEQLSDESVGQTDYSNKTSSVEVAQSDERIPISVKKKTTKMPGQEELEQTITNLYGTKPFFYED